MLKIIDKTKPVMITGATGYVAGWIVKKLLDEGFTVHAAVRNPANTSDSHHFFKQLGNGKMKTGVPDFHIGMVDVRDVAEAHFRAGFTPEANGRHITSAENTSFWAVTAALQNKFGNAYPFPKRVLPKFLIWLMAPAAGLKRKMISRNVGYPWKVDNSKGIRELGMKYRPVKVSAVDFFQQMIDNKVFEKK